jgi:hypothetical protein
MSTPKFTDADDREWPLTLDFPDVSRIKKLTNVDLLSNDDLTRCTGDLMLMVDVMYAGWKELADEREVTDEAFGRLVSHSFEASVQAFNEALADFFHRIGRGPMATLIRKGMELAPTQTKQLAAKLAPNTLDRLLKKSLRVTELEIDSELAKAEAEMDAILGNEFTSLEQSSASPILSGDESLTTDY